MTIIVTCGALLGHLGDVENSAATSVGHQQQLLSVLQCDRTEMLSLHFFAFAFCIFAAAVGSHPWWQPLGSGAVRKVGVFLEDPDPARLQLLRVIRVKF